MRGELFLCLLLFWVVPFHAHCIQHVYFGALFLALYLNLFSFAYQEEKKKRNLDGFSYEIIYDMKEEKDGIPNLKFSLQILLLCCIIQA